MSGDAYYLLLLLLFGLGVVTDRLLRSRPEKNSEPCCRDRRDPEPDKEEFEAKLRTAVAATSRSRDPGPQCEYMILLIEDHQRHSAERGCMCIAGHDNLIRVAKDLRNLIERRETLHRPLQTDMAERHNPES